MASRKTRPASNAQDKVQYAELMKAILAGTVTATKVIESRDGQGKLVLQYDDPN